MDRETYTNSQTASKYLFILRLPIVLFSAISIGIIFLLLLKLVSYIPALLATALIIFTPIIAGMSQIINPDTTLWSTNLIALLAYFLYRKHHSVPILLLTGVFLGFASLSKYFAGFTYVFLLLIPIISYWLEKENKHVSLIKQYSSILLIFGVAMGIYAIFIPYTWIYPFQILKGTLFHSIASKGLLLALPVIVVTIVYDQIKLRRPSLIAINLREKLQEIHMYRIFPAIYLTLLTGVLIYSFSPLPGLHELAGEHTRGKFPPHISFFYSISIQLFKVPVLTLLLLMYSTCIFTIKKGCLSFQVSLLCSYILFFIVGAGIAEHLAGARYQIMLFPIIAILAGFSILTIKNNFFSVIYSIVVVIIVSIELLLAMPQQFSYVSPLNPHETSFGNGWGYGGYQAAQYANDSFEEYPTIWADYIGFFPFYKGTELMRQANPFCSKNEVEYLMLSNAGESVFRRSNLPLANSTFEQYLTLNTPIMKYYTIGPVYEYCFFGICTKIVPINTDDVGMYEFCTQDEFRNRKHLPSAILSP